MSSKDQYGKKNNQNREIIKLIFLALTTITISCTLIYGFAKLNEALQVIFFTVILFGFISLAITSLKPPLLLSFKNIGLTKSHNPSIPFKILVVDDNRANRRILDELLTQLSFSSVEVENGEQALHIYQQQHFDLIFMDIEMRGLSGLQVVAAIRQKEHNQRVPIIAISAHSQPEKKIEALIVGFDDYITKPINEEILKETLKRWLGQNSKKQPKFEALSYLDATATTQPKQVDDFPKSPEAESSLNTSQACKKVVDIQQSLIYSHNNPELAKDMLEILITMIINEKESIQSFFEQQDWAPLGEIVHKINGGSCYCGVPMLRQQAQLIDIAIQRKDYLTVKQSFPQLIKTIDDLVDWHEEHDLGVIFEN